MGTREMTALGALRRRLRDHSFGAEPGIAESFMLKAALYLDGTRLDDSAYEGVGERWKEEVQIYFFNPNLAVKLRDRPAPAAAPANRSASGCRRNRPPRATAASSSGTPARRRGSA